MPQPPPPAHMVIQPRMQAPPQPQPPPLQLPTLQHVGSSSTHVASYASAPAAHAPHMILSSTSQQEFAGSSTTSCARVHSAQSSVPPSARCVAAPYLSHRTPSEQAVIQALQAVANYPKSRDFVEKSSRRLQGLQFLPDTPAQLEGCRNTRRHQGPDTSAAAPRATSPIPGLSPVSDEELGHKLTSSHELPGVAGTNESPTSCPPPDKRHGVLQSVVIQEPPKVESRGTPEP